MTIQITQYGRGEALTDITGTGSLSAVQVRLFTAGPSMLPNTDVSAYTEATFDGYTAAAVSWGDPYIDSLGVYRVDSDIVEWVCTSNAVSENILGYLVISNSSGNPLLYGEFFDSPQTVNAVGDGVSLVLRYGMEDQPNFGAVLLSEIP